METDFRIKPHWRLPIEDNCEYVVQKTVESRSWWWVWLVCGIVLGRMF